MKEDPDWKPKLTLRAALGGGGTAEAAEVQHPEDNQQVQDSVRALPGVPQRTLRALCVKIPQQGHLFSEPSGVSLDSFSDVCVSVFYLISLGCLSPW